MVINKLLHIRIPENLYKKADNLSEVLGFSTIQEFFRDSLRKSIEIHEKQAIIKKLQLLKGYEGKINRLNKKERDRLFEEFIKKDSSEILRKYRLD
mgnify:FL=1